MAKKSYRKSPKRVRSDKEQQVTDKVIEALESGTAPWVMPWAKGCSLPTQAMNNRPYRGINLMLLMGASMEREFASNRWMTFNMAQDLAHKMMAADLGRHVMKDAPERGVKRKQKAAYESWMRERLEQIGLGEKAYPRIRKGAKGEMVFFMCVKEYDKTDDDGNIVRDANGEPKKEKRFIKNGFTVHNVEQFENLPDDVRLDPRIAQREGVAFDETLESMLEQAFPEVSFQIGGGRAFYQPGKDRVVMPDRERFNDQVEFYSTKLHECVHATGHASRLNRLTGAEFGSPEYAREELIAELGSAFLCAHLGLEGFLQHPEYIGHWIKVLQNDKREIFKAASQAQKACDFILEGMGLVESEDDSGTDNASDGNAS